ncbi:iron ABC transporter permease [Paenibacillus sp. GSMTC-2017]|uniref:FecCD family ABC transporter permease n=1 Tax=Paenibacillus sp. GSMTC-2017 TaxID=2794350 RepID=UPI0018D608D2|nr:iron ABC transporter permease [Paenibacillus sp. GSMTC-2017]MBH5317849.1 iron ABC transporter permease [Paenibacillus sp. GSMTC-2017]
MLTFKENSWWKILVIGTFLLLAIVCIFMSLAFGAVDVSLSTILAIVTGDKGADAYTIIWNIRLPRTFVAALVGMNLAVAGTLLQGVMRNPMADPHIIGVSSGAGLFGMFILLAFPSYTHLLIPSAFVGAMAAALLVYVLAWNKGVTPMRIILAGVAVSAFLNSLVSALFTFYSDRVQGALGFMVGTLSAKGWANFHMLLPYSIIGVMLALLGSKPMNLLLLGDSEARSLGLNTERYRLWFVAISALLAASAVSVVGLLGFVGLIVPHAARLLIGNDYRILLPCSALLGIAVLTASDTLARVVVDPIELPVGIVMGAVGAPFFLYLLRRKNSL